MKRYTIQIRRIVRCDVVIPATSQKAAEEVADQLCDEMNCEDDGIEEASYMLNGAVKVAQFTDIAEVLDVAEVVEESSA